MCIRDSLSLDIKRFEKFNSSLKFIKERTTETLGNLFKMHWPYKQLETSRNIKLLPYHNKLKKLGACFGQMAGFERPMWFSKKKVLNICIVMDIKIGFSQLRMNV